MNKEIKILQIDCMICKHTEEYTEEEQGANIFCSGCFSVINTDTADIRYPTIKELISVVSMFDTDYSKSVLTKYYGIKGVN
jgi:hypothetical protein|tara:strand:+ start:245 stop:487 length:243 start_codon:yes stop_codon:yes gene_type:complete